MNLKSLVASVLIVPGLSAVSAGAGQTIDEATVIACVVDKWDEKEPEKGHKLVDYTGRCVEVFDDRAQQSFTENCFGKYEYMPDGSWKGLGTCIRKLKDGEVTDNWEEGTHLKDYVYKVVSGTGKYHGATGGGTYTMENLTDTLGAGRLKGTLVLP
jgi:hypothetical protein